ncbi:hypothetical protein CHARACLAT_027119 [Characodon lateralis]|uniref:Uncharacterized protein n=1 Tax=Characodon lateralis TaxID=208331 RepID=A0ABU7DEL3_9TELE|nr:hypothetical protein [Characodon lateralis]
MNIIPAYAGARISGCWTLRSDGSGGGDGSLDRLLPSASMGLSPRKRTTSQCKSEPPLLLTSKRTIYTAGRPPWYNEHGAQSKEAFVIGRKLRKHVVCVQLCFIKINFPCSLVTE